MEEQQAPGNMQHIPITQIVDSDNNGTKEFIESLLDIDKVDLATEYEPREVIYIAILETLSQDALPSAEGLKIKLPSIDQFTKKFKVNRVSLKRKSRRELIEGLISQRLQFGEVGMGGFRGKIDDIIKKG